MSIKKATIFNWESGIVTSNRANSVEEMNRGFSMVKGFDVYADPKKAIPVPEFVRWNTTNEEQYQFKGLGSSDDTYFATGYPRKNWYSDGWLYRVRVEIASSEAPFNLIDLSNMPASFWSNTKSDLSDVRVVSEGNIVRAADIIEYDKTTQKGWISTINLGTESYVYIYYGNSTVDSLYYAPNSGYEAKDSWSNVSYIYVQRDGEQFPLDETQFDATVQDRTLYSSDSSQLTAGISGFITNGLGSNPTTEAFYRRNTAISYPSGTELTINFLFRMTSLPSSTTNLITDTFNNTVSINTSGVITWQVDPVTGAPVSITSSALSINTTYMISCVYSRSKGVEFGGSASQGGMGLYINGVLVNSTASTNLNSSLALGTDMQWRLPVGSFMNMISLSSQSYSASRILTMYNTYINNNTVYTINSQELSPELIDIDYNSTALYKKSLDSSVWSIVEKSLAIRVNDRAPVIAPIYAYSSTSNISFFTTGELEGYSYLMQAGGFPNNIITTLSSITDFYIQNLLITTGVGIDNSAYMTNGQSGLNKIAGAYTYSADVFAAFPVLSNVQSYNGYLALGGYRTQTNQSWVQIWDRADTVSTESIDFGLGQLQIVGNIKGTLFCVVSNFTDNVDKALNQPSMDVRLYQGGSSVKTTHKISLPVTMDGYYTDGISKPISQLKGLTRNAVVFYAKLPIDEAKTSFNEGLWALGKNEITDNLSLTLLYDTSSIGDVYNMSTLANQVVVFSDTNKVFSLNPSPTYSQTAEIETLIFNDGNSELSKKIVGVEIMHEKLTEGQVIQVYKKTENDADYVLIMESSLLGSISKENTKDMQGNAIGNFKEIQFKITSTGGKSAVTQFSFKYETLLTNV